MPNYKFPVWFWLVQVRNMNDVNLNGNDVDSNNIDVNSNIICKDTNDLCKVSNVFPNLQGFQNLEGLVIKISGLCPHEDFRAAP